MIKSANAGNSSKPSKPSESGCASVLAKVEPPPLLSPRFKDPAQSSVGEVWLAAHAPWPHSLPFIILDVRNSAERNRLSIRFVAFVIVFWFCHSNIFVEKKGWSFEVTLSKISKKTSEREQVRMSTHSRYPSIKWQGTDPRIYIFQLKFSCLFPVCSSIGHEKAAAFVCNQRSNFETFKIKSLLLSLFLRKQASEKPHKVRALIYL